LLASYSPAASANSAREAKSYPGLAAGRKPHRSVEEHRRSSFIAFGGPRAKAGLSPGRQTEARPTWDKLQLVQASQARPGPHGHDRSLDDASSLQHPISSCKKSYHAI
jgi:hypothetical protein